MKSRSTFTCLLYLALNGWHLAPDFFDLLGLLPMLFVELSLTNLHVLIKGSEVLLIPGIDGFAEYCGEGLIMENRWD